MCKFFREAETTLFDLHFSCMSEEEMKKFFHKIDKIQKKQVSGGWSPLTPRDFDPEDANSILTVFHSIKNSSSLSWKDITSLYLCQSRTQFFYLPFQCVLSLLGRREVTLDRGVAKVPLCKLREVISEQVSLLMKSACRQAVSCHTAAISDDRLRMLWRKLRVRDKKNS